MERTPMQTFPFNCLLGSPSEGLTLSSQPSVCVSRHCSVSESLIHSFPLLLYRPICQSWSLLFLLMPPLIICQCSIAIFTSVSFLRVRSQLYASLPRLPWTQCAACARACVCLYFYSIALRQSQPAKVQMHSHWASLSVIADRHVL